MSTPTTWTELEYRVNNTVMDTTITRICDKPVTLTDRERHAVRALLEQYLRCRDYETEAEEGGFAMSYQLARAEKKQQFLALARLVKSLTLGSYSNLDPAWTCTPSEAEKLARALIAWADQGWQ